MPLLRTFFGLAGKFRSGKIIIGLGASLAVSGVLLQPPETPVQLPSYIAWTEDTIHAATSGNAVRGLVIARRCERCHGREGFSSDPLVPNLAGMDRLTMWKQMNDFRDQKRSSPIMQTVANDLAIQDYADLAAYFSMLPTYPDLADTRSFPQSPPASIHMGVALRLVVGGDGQRGVPPCQACHGPIGHVKGAPSLMTQNAPYIQEQLEQFAKAVRRNDINMPMRSIAALLTEEEKQAVAAYYGAGTAACCGLSGVN